MQKQLTKKATPKAMKLIDPSTSLMECKVCGNRHVASLKNGKYRRGSWQCINGCEIEEKEKTKVIKGMKKSLEDLKRITLLMKKDPSTFSKSDKSLFRKYMREATGCDLEFPLFEEENSKKN